MLTLDHIFILVSPGAPEADALVNMGLIEGTSNDHPGQGTSNRRFFFPNTTIELLFINDIAEAVNGAGKQLKLMERAIDVEGSPFGLVTRWLADEPIPNFPHWTYQPDYFPKAMCFYVGENSDNFQEPLWICMPPALPVSKSPPTPNNSEWTLTGVEVSLPRFAASETLTTFSKCDMVSIALGEEHHLKLTFNHATKNQTMSFLPNMPLTIAW